MNNISPVHVIGGGLAGSEAAWQLARAGVRVVLHEMRPARMTKAHATGGLAELVCSNSLRSDDAEMSAIGLLHEEMRLAASIILEAADQNKVPAGGALAVDRQGFSEAVGQALESDPLITIKRQEVTTLPPVDWGSTIIATGPLTSPLLTDAIGDATGEDALAFFDALAPIVYKDSIDFSKAWFQSRYDKGEGQDYINCPLDKTAYEAFIEGLLATEKIAFRDWEKDTPYFEACLPIEVMAARGPKTLAYGPMKPVGLTNPHSPKNKPHAVVQLRQDNKLGTLYNMVGFQTKLTHAEQKRLFRTIPGLEKAEFARLGGLHRNTFINSPRLLDETLRLKSRPAQEARTGEARTGKQIIRFAGQITGCEGYVESAAIGLLAGRFTAAERLGRAPITPPPTTALGALLDHVTRGAETETFQPMNVNFGLFPPPPDTDGRGRPVRGKEKKKAVTRRALSDLAVWLED